MNKGFEYNGKRYVWHKKELYRLPFESNKRFFGWLKCAKWLDKGFILGSQRKSFSQLQAITVDVEWSIPNEHNPDTPF